MPKSTAACRGTLLLAGAALLAAHASPVRAASVEFLAGPLSLLAGQVAEVVFQDPDLLPGEHRVVRARVQCNHNAAATRRTDLAVTFAVHDLARGRTEAMVPGVPR